MSAPDPTVYTDPAEPGAPRVGDVVVVVADGAPGTSGPEHEHAYTGTIAPLCMLLSASYPWGLHMDSGWRWVHSVRRPTPEELAAYQLAQADRGGL